MTQALKRLIRLSAGLALSSLLLLAAFPKSGTISGPGNAFVYPVIKPRDSGDFGPRKHPIFKLPKHHSGMDLAAPYGAPIRAIAAGVVTFADPYGGYGNLVVLRHESGMTSHYGHCALLKVRPGQHVKAGQIIATVGSTGRTTGPHLHFEVRINGVAQDPDRYIPGLALDAEG